MEEDSFFGFDTSVPLDDDGGGGRIEEPSEEEYDALNDETFGSAVNGDWEEVHENLVRLGGNLNGSFSVESDGRNGAGNFMDAGAAGGISNIARGLSGGRRLQPNVSTPGLMNSRLSRKNHMADSDLELNLSDMKLDDVDLNFDDNASYTGGIDGGISLESSVWATHPNKISPGRNSSLEILKSRNQLFPSGENNNMRNGTAIAPDPSVFLREHFSSPFHEQDQVQPQQQRLKPEINYTLPPPGAMPKICTLADIERNLIFQQAIQKQQLQQQQQNQEQQQRQEQLQRQQQQYLNDLLKQSPKTPTPMQQQQNQMQVHLQKQAQQQQQHQKGPPGFPTSAQHSPRPLNNFTNNVIQHPNDLKLKSAISNLQQSQQQQPQPQQPNIMGNRLPPGFPMYPPGLGPHIQQQGHPQMPPHPLLNQHGLPLNFPHPHQRPMPNSHLPIALNNFAMHPNFNVMRAAVVGVHPSALVPPSQQPRLPPHPPNATPLLNQQQPNSMYNMFNMRLVQEIQQNHPLLQNAARQAQQQQQNPNMGPNSHMHQHQQQQRGLNGAKPNHHRRDGNAANGNLPHEEYDEFANLMSTRDKHWLIGIQLTQLNMDTPFIDDFYYTVHRERKAAIGGLRHSQAHKDNQLNHPLTQPKGHAQLILVQLGNKNGTRNGQHRERRSSESGGGNNNTSGGCQEQKTPYVFTPMKFENSLGKLQFGSVTAPRKIIDAEIMSGEPTAQINGNSSNTNQNLLAKTQAATAVSVASSFDTRGISGGDMASTAQRKSQHILLHIETLFYIILKLEDLDNPKAIATILLKKKKESERIAALEQLESANRTPEERAVSESTNPALKNKFAYEIEKKEDLIAKLSAGLTHDKVVAMMGIRKGKVLLHRIMLFIADHEIRWNVWNGVFASLQNVVKKDRDDAEGLLYALYPEFKKHIQKANFEKIVKISTNIPLNDKKSNALFCSRFGISSLVCLIIQAEQIYISKTDPTLNYTNKATWRQFLDQVATSLNRTIQKQTICAAIESDSIQPMMNHFARFKDLKLDSLLALITEAKQQIN